ncbi:bifunctional glutamate N-acetyltransferase/amino-acid acetyltransferase ArgJ [Chengkuizengella axinellae]|uniref:Arginine biosynthesis bifunctional protein ArgJ n=1 Tax=Chengkuizengella axinellae TaxID=3064388 RepID=A0ABT9J2U8_9BACL|nr:bifunctional glutamate N-acetyltransferase/amino-acid acetyltransferase ArgJ [Chengkuizengella sp. 2205SS18-9]MDP5275898.1 bifunctional glutamate N-acetyltransferase/amino-acid acetyltransferase ArgJ [Chengkuizengella sp. 2205SS18-9]
MSSEQSFKIMRDGSITTPKGFKACGLHCGIKKSMRYDIGSIVCEVPANAAAVYTLNKIQAAPIGVTKNSLQVEGKLQAVVANSGNANACTGKQGNQDALTMRSETAKLLGLPEHHVAVASTGVIGECLPMEKVIEGIKKLPESISDGGGNDFGQSILTTDLTEKNICVEVEVNGKKAYISGAAKGSGMIHPNMATMLGFITTDVNIEHTQLQSLLNEVTDESFNMITVDGDTSTNDMVLVMASGLVDNVTLDPSHPDWFAFKAAFQHVAEILAKEIARDGEGATKLVEVEVVGAETDEDARKAVKTIIGSSLVKSAIFGADANWGRIIAAVGRADIPVDPDTIDIRLGKIEMMVQSTPIPFDEHQAEFYLKKANEIHIHVNLNIGNGYAKGWGCDLTYEYVRINAAYRT